MPAGVVNLLGMQPVDPNGGTSAQSLGLNTPQQQNMNALMQALLKNQPRMRQVGIQPGMQPGSIPGAMAPLGGVPIAGAGQQPPLNYLQLLHLLMQRNPMMMSGEQAGSPLTMMMMGQGMNPETPV